MEKSENKLNSANVTPIEAIIFDMDGLMIDSERVTRDSYRKVGKERGFEVPDEFYVTLLGKNKENIFKRFKEVYGDDFPIEEVYPKTHEYIIDYYNEHGVPVKKGLVNLLKLCKENGIKTCIATSSNKHRVVDILERTGLTEYFDEMVCGDEIKHGKPAPDTFLAAAEKVNVEPSKALVLEDSENGIRASHAAGIPVYCVLDLKVPEPEVAKLADEIVEDLDQVVELVKKQNNLD